MAGRVPIIINNAEWLRPLPLLEFLRDIGKYFSVNGMVKMESVKTRLDREDGLSFTEFAYSLLQAYDFLELYTRFGCRLQLGGSDQWPNLLMGIDLIRRLRGVQAHGLVFPLVTTSAGVKFGKTEAGAVWLDPERTSPFSFHQFFFNTDDRDVGKFLRYFTQLDEPQIAELEEATARHPERREAQRRLAAAVTELVHGPTELAKAVRASAVLFGQEVENLTAREVAEIFADVPTTPLPTAWIDGSKTATDLAVQSGLATSKGEARRLIQAGGLYINNRRVTEPATQVTTNHTVEGRFVVLRKGSKQYHLITLQE